MPNKFEHAVDDAIIAFFAELAKHYPDIKTGDIDFETWNTFRIQCEGIAETWLHENTPNVTLTPKGK